MGGDEDRGKGNMQLRLNITSKLSNRSERVKWVELHPSEPWLLAALYSGHVMIWNYATETLVRSIEVVELPVRGARFIVRKQWFICGSDDFKLRVYNYNTSEKLREWEAHNDYIRCIEVHPSQPVVLTSSDDLTIKLWNWEKRWDLMQTFEAHSHYVMQVKLNPKDTNTFASASLDKTIKVWGITGGAKGGTTLDPHFTLEGHEKGVNCIDYYPGADKPYLLSGADDFVVRIWDYQTKACVSKLEGHTNNISAVAFHPKLPVIISASEDTTVRVWHANTYRLEKTLNYRFERAWSVGVSPASNKVAIGFDEGSIVIKLGKESPVISMDKKTGKLMWTRNNEVF